jgi:Glycosyl transferase family 2
VGAATRDQSGAFSDCADRLALQPELGPGNHGGGTKIRSKVLADRCSGARSLPTDLPFAGFSDSGEVGRGSQKASLAFDRQSDVNGMSRARKFSVIIPTYNRLEFLKNALSSVWTQTFTDYEVIVVDDGSTDGTAEWLVTQGKRVRTITQANRGPGAARNLGARNAAGAYLAFLDSDDLWFPWTLEVYLNVIEEHRGPCFIAGKPVQFCDENELKKIGYDAVRTERFVDYLASGDEWRWWSASSFVVCRDAFGAVGGFVENPINGEDADLALRLGVAPGFVQVISPVTFGYREHAESAMKDLKRTVGGAQFMVCAERAGCYPGGEARAPERYRILTRNTRPVTISCLQEGQRREAWALYISTFAWNASLGRVKYLTAFPFLAVAEQLRRAKTTGSV